ncbi:HD domain-containing protein [Pontibacter sp. KCTC 32443]|uniref:HD domain-containing protein n=1 Tax=Pontibacter TaxID=323449 RepID=UPI00164ECA7F|nr:MULTISPECIES: HD domain-containing protein [Pontibacter]MBC5772614.1 HD domain-containing protein [Pontibacter sp. KCTC 32443]
MKKELKSILEVITLAERLKSELRHSWLSDGRQESVAEHTWRMALMAVLLEPYLDEEVDTAHMLKMILVHDLVEIEAGDVPAFQVMTEEAKAIKLQKELTAIESLREKLGIGIGQHVYELWHEFEAKATYEAKVANALDKLEVRLQHNHADIATWLEVEQENVFRMGDHTGFDSCLDQLKDLIQEQAVEKMEKAGISTTNVLARMASRNAMA